MAYILSENEIKDMIGNHVIKYLNEAQRGTGGAWSDKKRRDDDDVKDKEGESEAIKNIRQSLRVRGLNRADLCRYMIRTGIWAHMTLDAARSKMTKFANGGLKPDEQELQFITRGLRQISASTKP